MTKNVVITGSASGIGAATAAKLASEGYAVFGIDRAGADCNVDLGTPEGRSTALEAARTFANGSLSAFVPCAGISGLPGREGSLVASVNYFGTVSLIEGLRDLLAAAGASSVVAISSNSTTTQPGVPMDVVEACLAGDEAAARSLADAASSIATYPATKLALAWWIRAKSVDPSYVGHGIHLNAIAPGMIETAMVAEGRNDPTIGKFFDLFPIPRGQTGRPEEIAGVISMLLSDVGRNFVGSVLFVDGGTDALNRTRDFPSPL
jgi:NAD(P)-dependent dehydrogenase (short-subunit alcohol dehydrogenase family)